MILRSTTALLVLLMFCKIGIAQDKDEGATQLKQEPVAEKATRPIAKIRDVKWIAGDWYGSGMGGEFEESWNPPFAGSMMGMFKFAPNGKEGKQSSVLFYELLTIVEKDESLLLRLKHFDKDLNGWEEKDKSIEFPLIKLSETEAAFDGLVFRKVDDSTMHIVVTMEQSGTTSDVKFVCKRRSKTGAAQSSSDASNPN